MELLLTGANIVILAKNHNPSIVSKEWLIQKKIIEGDIINFAHTPAFSVVETDTFSFVEDPDRLQISVKNDIQNKIGMLSKMAKSYVSELPETPYTAIGFNYLYSISSEKDILKHIYSVDDDKFKKLFSENYQLGGIIKFNFNDFLVKTNLQPNDNKIIADVNFHCDLKDVDELLDKIESCIETEHRSEEILEELFNV